MDLKRLTHLIALAEEGRFTKAAQRVHLSPAAFSRSIQALEEQSGLRLFDRDAQGARPTPAGQMVLARARSLVQDSRGLQRDIAMLKDGDVGEIRIGAAPIPAAVLVPELLCQLRQQSPQLVTRVHMGTLPKLLEQLDAEELDFCLGDPRLLPKSPRYAMASVGKQPGGLYCRRGHPLARKAVLTPEHLSSYGLALISMTPALQQGVARACGLDADAVFPRVVECDDLGTLAHLVEQTDVIGLLPHAMGRKADLRALVSGPGQPQTLVADVQAIWLKARTRAPAVVRAIGFAREIGLRGAALVGG